MERFSTTRWTLIHEAAGDLTPAGRAALSTLCERYWPPLYAYLRGRGYTSEDAQDLTQSFFVHLLERHAFEVADRARGRFRSFLLTALKHHVAHVREHDGAVKRGGAAVTIPLDVAAAERTYVENVRDAITPETIFIRQWAVALLERVLTRLADEYGRNGKGAVFEHLKPALTAPGVVPYRQIASVLNVTEGSVRVAVHRLRRRYREILREEIADTVAAAEDIEGELACLMSAVSA